MNHPDSSIYLLHAGCWTAFVVTRQVMGTAAPAVPRSTAANQQRTAPHSRLLLGIHAIAFAVLYLGLPQPVFHDGVPAWFPGQRLVGAALMLGGTALMCWSLVYFRSWRFRAKLDQDHVLATGGPYAWVRHPIYAGLNLLALGTAVWVPTPILWMAVLLMFIGSDLRGRAEEQLLTQFFGEQYRSYCVRTRRFIPGLY